MAAFDGRVGIIDKLIAKKANINAKDAEVPLLLPAKHGISTACACKAAHSCAPTAISSPERRTLTRRMRMQRP
jgi:hypothetical protein